MRELLCFCFIGKGFYFVWPIFMAALILIFVCKAISQAKREKEKNVLSEQSHTIFR